ncbi:hypothetical protein NFI96_032181, partial [Prochilodus magdalenae]
FAERFRVTADEGKFDLSIINTVDEDTGTYFCVKLKDYVSEFGSGTLLLFTGRSGRPAQFLAAHWTVVERTSLNKLTAILDNTSHPLYDLLVRQQSTFSNRLIQLRCTKERHGSGESHPGIIYTHGNRSDQCKNSSETDSSTQSCVYKLPKRNLSLSDAGTYYCAVAACGQILFGNGTEVNVQENNNWLVTILLSSNLVCVTAIMVLLGVLLKTKRKG